MVVLEQRVSLRAGGVHEQLAERVAPAAEPLELRDAEPALRQLLGPAAAAASRTQTGSAASAAALEAWQWLGGQGLWGRAMRWWV